MLKPGTIEYHKVQNINPECVMCDPVIISMRHCTSPRQNQYTDQIAQLHMQWDNKVQKNL